MITPTQKIQLDDWLRQADKCIREGRYIGADEFLQKVFKVQPENTTAHTYQDRIQFLVNQLAQRIGLQSNLHAEIRKYREMILQRKSNEINICLVQARQFLESGSFDNAADQVRRALAIDVNNLYAKELQNRINELRGTGGEHNAKEQEYMFRALIKESWGNGRPSEDQQRIITGMQQKYNITEEQYRQHERDVKSELYFEVLHGLWLDGGLVGFTDEIIAELMKRFSISRIEHAAIESKLLNQVRKNRVRGTIMIVDSDDSLLKEFTYKLRLQSFAIISAIDVDEALASMKLVKPTFVLSEVEFPGKASGFDLFQAIRLTSEGRNIPVFFLTSSLDRTTQIIGKRLGVDEFFTKPLDYELLLATLSGKLLASKEQKQPSHRPTS
jgi:CheY-like chemotaxis protein